MTQPRTVAGRLAPHRRLAVGVVALMVATQLVPKTVPLGIVVQGALFGAVYGLLGLGLVLVYRTTRVVNFAYGAMGGLAGTAAVLAFQQWHWSWYLCVAVAVALGCLVGVLTEVVVIRRFATSSRLVLTVATIGLAQLLGGLQVLLPGWFGASPLIPSFETPLSNLSLRIDPIVLSGNDLVLLAVVPAVLAGLSWFLLRTEAGMAVRAIAENTDRALLLGLPVRRLSVLVWSIIGGLAALTVVVRAPGSGLTIDAAAGPAVLLPALAAATVARMSSLPTAFGAGLGLGVLEAVTRWNVDKQAVTSVVFVAVIMAALLAQRGSGDRAENADEATFSIGGGARRLPETVRGLPEMRIARLVPIPCVLAALAWIGATAAPSDLNRISASLIYAIVAVSLIVLVGWSGTTSLGQFAVVGLGAVVTANLIVRLNVDLFVAMAASGVAGGLIAVAIGLPALRVRGLFLAVTTLAFAVAVDSYFLNPVNYPDWLPAQVDRPVLFKHFDLHDERALFFLCLGVLAVAVIVVANLRRARTGRVLIALRDNPRAAAAMAVPVTRDRLAGFVISGVLAGVAGSLHTVLVGSIGYHAYEPSLSILALSMAVIGGITSISGTLMGVALVQWTGYTYPKAQLILTGVFVLVVLWALPGGLGEALTRVRDRFATFVARRHGIALDEAGADGTVVGTRMADASTPSSPASGAAASANGSQPAIAVTAAPDAADVLLAASDLTASYGQLQVLFGVDLTVARGELVALLGTNGAGKSTLLKAIVGLMPSRGAVTLEGRSLHAQTTDRVARMGVALMPGGKGIFPTLSVTENLRLANWQNRRAPAVAATALRDALSMFPRMQERLDIAAGNLSGGEQQQLSLAMALMTRPQLLCIDELSLGLAPTIVDQLCDKVREIHRAGTTIVIVEQSLQTALRLAERAVFMEKGRVRFSGPAADLLDRPDIMRAVFIGSDTTATNPEAASPRGDRERPPTGVSLECRSLTKRYGGITVLDSVDLTIPAGAIVGLVGHNGAGKTTLFDAISGFLPVDAGSVLLDGSDITALDPTKRAIAGLGRSFQEARLFPSLTVVETIKVALERHLASHDPIAAALALPASYDSEDDADDRVDELLDQFGLRGYQHHRTGELSTGTRRIVEIACMVAQDPAVILLDEPTAGVAQTETKALVPVLRKLHSDTGCTTVLIEHDLDLLRAVCDHLVALELGAVIASGSPSEVLSHPRVIASYLGTAEQTTPTPPKRRDPRRRAPLRAPAPT